MNHSKTTGIESSSEPGPVIGNGNGDGYGYEWVVRLTQWEYV
jgi:hypothetical protein